MWKQLFVSRCLGTAFGVPESKLVLILKYASLYCTRYRQCLCPNKIPKVVLQSFFGLYCIGIFLNCYMVAPLPPVHQTFILRYIPHTPTPFWPPPTTALVFPFLLKHEIQIPCPKFPALFPQQKRGKEMLLAPLCRCGKLSFFFQSVMFGNLGSRGSHGNVPQSFQQQGRNCLIFVPPPLRKVGNASPFPCQIVLFLLPDALKSLHPFFQSSQAKSLNFPSFKREKKQIFFSGKKGKTLS